MAIRDDFTAGEVLAAADLNDTFASKIPYAYGTATPSTTVDGFVWYDENETPPAPKFWDGAAFQALGAGGGKVLQVVRATDTTERTTTSSSYVDVTGMSVTITPQQSTSAIILIMQVFGDVRNPSGNSNGSFQITDSSNNPVSSANDIRISNGGSGTFQMNLVGVGYATPATTSATTYKVRFANLNSQTTIAQNGVQTGQVLAIEVSA